jgi:hypothetical protein
VRVLYTLTIFIGSALLFLIEPAIAKLILPVFGGAPAVWSASLLFFQGALLAGYAYAHGSIRKFGVKKQSFIHLGMMVFAGLFLPFGSSSPALPRTPPHVAPKGQSSPASAKAIASSFLFHTDANPIVVLQTVFVFFGIFILHVTWFKFLF